MNALKDEEEDEMLEYCSCNCSGDIVDFIDSLIDFKAKFGYLSDKQRAALEKIYYVQQQKGDR